MWRGVENGEQYTLQRVDNKIVVCCMCNKRCACEQRFYGMTFTITLIQIPDNLVSNICLYVSYLTPKYVSYLTPKLPGQTA